MTYKHLSQTERYQIQYLLSKKVSQRAIAQELNRSPATISREIRRNQGLRGYRHQQAQRLMQLRSTQSRNALTISESIWTQCQTLLKRRWSPEQISALLAMSHETIYQRVYQDKRAGGDLYRYLRCQKQRKKRYGSGQERRGQIRHRRSIKERPAHIERRKQLGHWEADTIIGAHHQQAIITLVERKSGYAMMAKVEYKTAQAVSAAIISRLEKTKSRVKTITYDNGKEFSEHETINSALSCTSYFADPFCSWQRGSNENFNGLVRQYIPKKRALSSVTESELAMIEYELNNRPRKRLGYKTPREVFFKNYNRVALRT